jgi:hypothetical protein
MKFCLSDPLFRHVLGQVEKYPETTFSETELRKISSDGFQEMLKGRFLKYQQSDPDKETFPCPMPCDKGCDRVIGKIGGSYRAICPGDSSVQPIILANGDLNRYIFDVDKLLSIISSKNQLVGQTSQINDRILFIGGKSIGQDRVAVMLGLFKNGREAESILLGLNNEIPVYDRTVILLPFCDKVPQSVLRSLENQNIVVATFEEAFPRSDFLIDFARLEAKRPKTGLMYPQKTPKQQRDYDKYGYLCEDRLFFTGIAPKERSNLIQVNDKKIRVPDNEMLLLIHLAMELKREEGGWVDRDSIDKERITEEGYPYRVISRLRNRLLAGLLDGDAKKFIENDGEGSYRISTHPDFVTSPDKNWAFKKFNELKESLGKGRERREDQKRRREKT